MLGKLMSLDLKSYRAQLKLVTPIYFLLIASAFVLKFLRIPLLGDFAHGLGFLATLLLIPAALAMGLIHYYRHFYTNQGYLTHTLPVTPQARYHAKLYSGFILFAVATVYALIGGFVLLLANGVADPIGSLYVRETLYDIANWPKVFSLHPVVGWLLLFLTWLLIYLYAYAAYSVSISVGMGKRLSRFALGGPVLAYIGYYVVNQVVGLAAFLFVPLSLRISLVSNQLVFRFVTTMPYEQLKTLSVFEDSHTVEDAITQVGGYFDFGFGLVIFLLLMMVASYFITNYQLKRINLR